MNDKNKSELGKILILEDDSSLANMVMNELRSQGISDLDHCDDGAEAWNHCQKDKYDFILMDWKVPNLSSLALFNRLKKDEYYRNIPVLVMSGFLNSKDFSLLGEYHNSSNIEKPFSTKFLISKMHILKKESNWYLRQDEKIKNLLNKFDNVEESEFQNEMISLLSGSPNPLPITICIGRALREKGEIEQAKKVFLSAKKYGDNAVIFSELGKIFLMEGDYDNAKIYLEKACEISPDNLERICNLGNLYLENLELGKAEKAFSKGVEIDGEDEVSKSGQLLTNNIEKWMAGAISVPETFAGILNSVGVTMVRSGDFVDGIEHYNSALLHVEDNTTKAKLIFNLGLGYLRWNKPKKALEWFNKAKSLSPEYEKVDNYIKTLNDKLSNTHPTHTSSDPKPNPVGSEFCIDENVIDNDDESSDSFEFGESSINDDSQNIKELDFDSSNIFNDEDEDEDENDQEVDIGLS